MNLIHHEQEERSREENDGVAVEKIDMQNGNALSRVRGVCLTVVQAGI